MPVGASIDTLDTISVVSHQCNERLVIVGNMVDRRFSGVEAVSTRAVAAAAGVQPPVIYRQFGDNDGLLDAVTHYLLRKYTKAKLEIIAAADDLVDQLRQTWDLHVEFGLTHPNAYVLAYVTPRQQGRSGAAAKETVAIMREVIAHIGEQGKSVERAMNRLYASGLGITLTLMQLPPSEQDRQLSDIARENALSAILSQDKRTRVKSSRLPARAVALAEALRATEDTTMTPGEHALLIEWLDRLADRTT
jgi:AcrR family transcriptional regulator